MSNFARTLLSDTGDFWNFTGIPVRGNGWFSSSNPNHTVALSVLDFRGRFILEGTLILEPTENDWFTISLDGTNYWISFPLDPFNPTGLNGGDTRNLFYNIKGNFVWLRAKISRTHILPTPPIDPYNYGKVIKATVV